MDVIQSLSGKVAVVTGSGSGIGLSVAAELLSQGSRVVGVFKSQESIDKIREYFGQFEENFLPMLCDVTSEENVDVMTQNIIEKFGKIDFLVNCVGVSIKENRGVLSMDNFNGLLSTNLTSVYLCVMSLAYKYMNVNGSVVNVASIRARTGTPTHSVGYAAAKAGVVNITKSFAMDLSKDGIRVNCVCPGLTFPTRMSENLSQHERDAIAKSIPLGRLGSPDDVADVILFLLSDLSRYVTGQSIDVNGGAWMN